MSQPQCPATSKTSGQQCKRLVMIGSTVCDFHGGKSKQALTAAKMRLSEARARQFLHEQEIEPTDDPLGRFGEIIAETDAMYRFVRDKVAQMDVDEWESETAAGGLQMSSYVTLMERYLDRLQRFLVEWQRLGLDERLAQVNEAVADKIISAIDLALAGAGIGSDQAKQVLALAGHHLRAL